MALSPSSSVDHKAFCKCRFSLRSPWRRELQFSCRRGRRRGGFAALGPLASQSSQLIQEAPVDPLSPATSDKDLSMTPAPEVRGAGETKVTQCLPTR